MQFPVYSLAGEVVEQMEISENIFGLPFNNAVVHQAMVRQLANRRQGTASTKTRSEVRGSTRKLFSQKHTGRARRGDIKSPLLRGGGVVFGPKPRSYHQSMPKKMRRLAIKCILSTKAREGNIKLIEKLDFKEPKTIGMLNILASLNVEPPILILTARSMPNVVKSAGNLPDVKVLPSALINVVDLLSYKTLLATAPAIHNIEQIWGHSHLTSPLKGDEASPERSEGTRRG